MPAASFVLPSDAHGRFAQALAPKATLTLAISGTANGDILPTARNEGVRFTSETHVVRIYASTDCYIAFGVESATASNADMFFAQGTETFKVPQGCNYISAKTVVGNPGTLSLTLMQ